MTRAYYDNMPPKIEAVGNGNYLYRWDIQEEIIDIMANGETAPFETRVQYSCFETTVHGKPGYGKCVEAVIRESYTSNEEIALANKYNAYQMGVHNDHSIMGEYEKYLSFVADVKNMVRQDLGEETPIETGSQSPRLVDVARLMTMTVNTIQLSDDDALSMKSLYPTWESKIGLDVKKDDKMQYGGKLWKVLQPHKVQGHYKPGAGTESLYTEIVENAAGTLGDPIPYDNNMELFAGKYYSQDGVTYLCTRNTGQPVYNRLADLVGLYVEKNNSKYLDDDNTTFQWQEA